MFEWARLREFWSGDPDAPATYLGDTRNCGRGVAPDRLGQRCLDGRTVGVSLYAEDKLYLLDTRLVITAGVRGEIMQQGFYDLLLTRISSTPRVRASAPSTATSTCDAPASPSAAPRAST